MVAKTLPGRSAARRFADQWEADHPKAVGCLRDDLDELLACLRYKSLEERKKVMSTNTIERRFREVRRRTRPMGVFSDRTRLQPGERESGNGEPVPDRARSIVKSLAGFDFTFNASSARAPRPLR